MSNVEAMKRTHSDYIENIRAVKGEAAVKFVEKVSFILASGDCINYALRTGDKRDQATDVMVTLISRCITMIAEETGVKIDDVMGLIEDTRVMMDSVGAAADMPKIALN